VKKSILIDAREFVPGRFTGIARVLTGLVQALAEHHPEYRIRLATCHVDAIPEQLVFQRSIRCRRLPASFPAAEWMLTQWTRSRDLFISPYPKLPIFGCFSRAIHTVHDVLDLTHPVYRKTIKAGIDRIRLKIALRRADLTWYDSNTSMQATRCLVGTVGRNPKVRNLAVSDRFSELPEPKDTSIRTRYGLQQGYILVLGNGLPHKNLGVLLTIGGQMHRPFVFVGVSERNRAYWRKRFPNARGNWIPHIPEIDLPAILRGAFCLAQPSTAEGYGYPPLEAMASGIPAVVSDIPVLREITGESALIARPDDPRAWQAALQGLENPERRRRQIAHGMRWVRQFRGRQGWVKHIDDICDLLGEPWRRKKRSSQE